MHATVAAKKKIKPRQDTGAAGFGERGSGVWTARRRRVEDVDVVKRQMKMADAFAVDVKTLADLLVGKRVFDGTV